MKIKKKNKSFTQYLKNNFPTEMGLTRTFLIRESLFFREKLFHFKDKIFLLQFEYGIYYKL